MEYTTISNIQQNKKNKQSKNRTECPPEFLGPITRELILDPVFTEDGHTYERSAIKQWFNSSVVPRSPLTNIPLMSSSLVQNHALKSMIDRYRNALGVELLDICKFHPLPGLLQSIDDLLQLGVNPNIRNSTGDTPLMLLFHNTHHSLSHNSEEVVKCIHTLVTAGALMSCVNDHNLTLLDMVTDIHLYTCLSSQRVRVDRDMMVTVSLLEKKETSIHTLQRLLPSSHKTEEHMALVLSDLNAFISTSSELSVILKAMDRYVTSTVVWAESASVMEGEEEEEVEEEVVEMEEGEEEGNYEICVRFIIKNTIVIITWIAIPLVVNWL